MYFPSGVRSILGFPGSASTSNHLGKKKKKKKVINAKVNYLIIICKLLFTIPF
jgi:hypothetical protein